MRSYLLKLSTILVIALAILGLTGCKRINTNILPKFLPFPIERRLPNNRRNQSHQRTVIPADENQLRFDRLNGGLTNRFCRYRNQSG